MGGSPCHCGRGIEVSPSQDITKNYLHTSEVCKQISSQMIKLDTRHKTLNSSLKHMFVQLKKDNITTCTIQYKAGDRINNGTQSILSIYFTRWEGLHVIVDEALKYHLHKILLKITFIHLKFQSKFRGFPARMVYLKHDI